MHQITARETLSVVVVCLAFIAKGRDPSTRRHLPNRSPFYLASRTTFPRFGVPWRCVLHMTPASLVRLREMVCPVCSDLICSTETDNGTEPSLLIGLLPRNCFCGSILVLKVGTFERASILLVSRFHCHTSTWLARSCNATKLKSQGPAHSR